MHLVGAHRPSYVAEEEVFLAIGDLVLEPPTDGVVVVCARVCDAVSADVVGCVEVLCYIAVKPKQQDPHPRKPKQCHHLADIGGDVTEVLGDDREARPAPDKVRQEFTPRRIDPAAVLRRRRTGRDLPVLDEPPEMIEPQPVEKSEGALDPALPPRKPLFPVRLPAVDRVSP